MCQRGKLIEKVILFDYNPNRALIPVRVLWIVDHVVRLILQSVAGVVKNMAGQMPASK